MISRRTLFGIPLTVIQPPNERETLIIYNHEGAAVAVSLKGPGGVIELAIERKAADFGMPNRPMRG